MYNNKKIEGVKKHDLQKSKMSKAIVGTMLGCMLVTESAADAQASFLGMSMDVYTDTITKSASKSKYGDDDPFRVYIAGSTTMEVSTPVLLRHTVESDGKSKGSISKKNTKSYLYSYPKEYHTLEVTIVGISAKIKTDDLSVVEEKSNSKKFDLKADTYSYDLISTCYSLIGYKERHTFTGKSTKKKKNETGIPKTEIVSVSCTCSYGF